MLSKIKTILFSTFIVAVLCNTALAVNKQQQPLTNQSQKQAKQKNSHILLYNDPQSKKANQQLPLSTRLIPIYKKGAWVKVGIPKDGQVGWINLKQYQQAWKAYYQPNIQASNFQTVYVHIDKNNSGKPTVNVMAYRNGKPLSKKQALALYQRLRKEQSQQFKAMEKMNQSLNQLFDQNFQRFQPFFKLNQNTEKPCHCSPKS